MKSRFFLILVIGFFIVPTSFVLANTIFEEIICRVNNEIITSSEYEEAKNLIKRQLSQNQEATSSEKLTQILDERQKLLLSNMIEDRLLVQKAMELKMTADTDVIKYLDRLRKENSLPTIEALEKVMLQQGINPIDFKKRLKDQSLREQVLGREVYYRIQITNTEINDYYESHQEDFNRKEQVRISEILILTEDKNSDGIKLLRKRAEEVLEKARSGEKFDELALEYSKGPTARTGGDLGFFPKGQLRKEIEDVTFALRRGQITGILKTPDGFRIFKVTEKHQAGLQSLESVKDEINSKIIDERAKPAIKRYLTKLRSKSYIQIKSGYVDSGAGVDPSSAKDDPIASEVVKPLTLDAEGKK